MLDPMFGYNSKKRELGDHYAIKHTKTQRCVYVLAPQSRPFPIKIDMVPLGSILVPPGSLLESKESQMRFFFEHTALLYHVFTLHELTN